MILPKDSPEKFQTANKVTGSTDEKLDDVSSEHVQRRKDRISKKEIVFYVTLILAVVILSVTGGVLKSNSDFVNDFKSRMSFVTNNYDDCTCTTLATPSDIIDHFSPKLYTIGVKCPAREFTFNNTISPYCFGPVGENTARICRVVSDGKATYSERSLVKPPMRGDNRVLYGISQSPVMSPEAFLYSTILGSFTISVIVTYLIVKSTLDEGCTCGCFFFSFSYFSLTLLSIMAFVVIPLILIIPNSVADWGACVKFN
jgi:hypothetical protein